MNWETSSSNYNALTNISCNLWSFHNQKLENDKWSVFKYRGLHFLHLNVNFKMIQAYSETNVTVIRISEWKLGVSMLILEIQISKCDILRCGKLDMEASLLAILEIILVTILNLISLRA